MDDFSKRSFTEQLAMIFSEWADCGLIDNFKPTEGPLSPNSRIVGPADDKILKRLFFSMVHCSNDLTTMRQLQENFDRFPEADSLQRRIVIFSNMFLERILELFEVGSSLLGTTFHIAFHEEEFVLVAIDPVAPTFG